MDVAGMIQCLKRHASSHTAITDNRHCLAPAAGLLCGNCHAQSGANRSAGMSDTETVEFAFISFGERRQATGLADRLQPVLAPGQNFMYICLVTNIPDQSIIGSVVDIV